MAGLQVAPGSGCGLLFKGDYLDNNWHIEAKSTRNDIIRVKKTWWEKALRQAKQTKKEHVALIVGWDTPPESYRGTHSIFVLVKDDRDPDDWSSGHACKTYASADIFTIDKETGENFCTVIQMGKYPRMLITESFDPDLSGPRLKVLTMPQFVLYKKEIDEADCD